MTVPVLTEQDLAELAVLAADLNFADPERRAVLLESGSRDINAAPGSGKTTVLAAKLLLLGRRWVQERNGVCVLSHTNVAREEIQRRLGANPGGNRLLAYPHFIGTIHAFVNQFLALPYMRSNGLEVDVIDDDVFSRRAHAIASANWNFHAYMGKNPSVAPMVAGLVYRGPDLEVGSEGGKLPGPEAKTRPFILSIKQTLTDQGIYRYADMFAFAERLLAKSPHFRERLSTRFPLVFIDEMQDTSWEQERLLQLMFDDSVVIQRTRRREPADSRQRRRRREPDVSKGGPVAHQHKQAVWACHCGSGSWCSVGRATSCGRARGPPCADATDVLHRPCR